MLKTSAVILAALMIYGFFIEPAWIEIRTVFIHDEKWAEVMKGLTVVQVSDLHITCNHFYTEKVASRIEAIRPDIIFITGDIVDWGGDYEAGVYFLSRLNARIGIWAVLGDSDGVNSRKSCLFCHEPGSIRKTSAHRVKFLRDEYETIVLNNRKLVLYGIWPDNEHHWQEHGMETNDPTIILAHSPEVFDRINSSHPVLVLSGDLHGGQVRLPSLFWNMIGYKTMGKYREGLFSEQRKRLYVSRGIGTAHIRFRLLERPEITILRFVP